MNGVENSPRPGGQADTKFWFEMAVVLVLLAFGGWLFYSGALSRGGLQDGSVICRILPSEYCDQGVKIEYLGHSAMAFKVADGTELHMPFDGAYFNETPEGMEISVMRLGVLDSSSSVVLIGRHAPYLESSTLGTKGELLGVTVDDPWFGVVDDETEANLVIYTEGSDF
jgi:hypothetical protein